MLEPTTPEGVGVHVTVDRPYEAQEWTMLAVDCFVHPPYYIKAIAEIQ
jgi:hypothetical protein